MEQIKITLETLYDLLRNEKKREDLQKLEDTFFLDLVSYLKEKKALLSLKKEENQIFSSGEREKLDYELRSIQKIVKELYEKREKKIIDISLNRSKTGSDIIDTSSMLREEKEFYHQLLLILDNFRKGILFQILQNELPSLKMEISKTMEERKEQIRAELEIKSQTELRSVIENKPVQEKSPLPPETPKSTETAESTETTEPIAPSEPKPSPIPPENISEPKIETETKPAMTKVKFIHPLPQFIWKDMKVYGPYERDQEVEIFSEIAELLVRKKRADKM